MFVRYFTLAKTAIRVVDKSLFRDHTNPLLVKNRCLKFHDLISLTTLLIVHRAKNNNFPAKIQKLLKSMNEIVIILIVILHGQAVKVILMLNTVEQC